MKMLRRKNGVKIKISKTTEDRLKLIQIAIENELFHPRGYLKDFCIHKEKHSKTKDPIVILYLGKKPVVCTTTIYIPIYDEKLLACFTKEEYRRKGYGTLAVVELLKAHTEQFSPHGAGFVPCYNFYRNAIQIATKSKG